MDTSKRSGQAVGFLLLVQLITGLILPYILLLPVSSPAGAFLEGAAPMTGTVRLSVLMLFLGGATGLGIAIIVLSRIGGQRHKLGLWMFSLAVANFVLQLIENAHWLSLLSISQSYGSASDGDLEGFRTLGIVAHTWFRWTHYSHILIVVAWLFTLYLLFYRDKLVPRTIAAFGMGGALLHFIGIILPAFGGYRMPYPDLFGASLALATLAAAAWLGVKGFANATPE